MSEYRLKVANVLWQQVQRFLFRMDPEDAHVFTVRTLERVQQCGFVPLVKFLFRNRDYYDQPIDVGGVPWRNPVGIAAGFIKQAEPRAIVALEAFGPGAIEIGTVTPRIQIGNPRPRVFRYPEIMAFVNRYGFNSIGIETVARRLSRLYQKYHIPCPIGVSIGKNADTLKEKAVDDYVTAFSTIYPLLRQEPQDYVKINISSPNTLGLRDIVGYLDEFLSEFSSRTGEFTGKRYPPIYLKVPPDNLTVDQYEKIVEIVARYGISAIEATNTTTNTKIKRAYNLLEVGGVSGEPLRVLSTDILRTLQPAAEQYGIDLIGVGGISHGSHAIEKMEAGARSVQCYTGLVFRGPQLIGDILETVKGV